MTQFNRATLAKVLDVLGSEHAGEALAAAKLATAMVREAGFSWDEVLRDLPARRAAPASAWNADSASAPGPGPMGMRRERDLSPYEQFFMLLLSPRTPNHVKKELRGWEARVLDGEITPQEKQDLRQLFKQFVA
ncbi:hypothetical protein FHP25_31610 [Vineibacter terrae]|uniref:Uncharacterized protein n=1 Tax=Vineibacter terrae TaxID=2586908 RepID=A0A5C8PBH3_9HYPH|nr:hypothetical protein [Vineibacter terrae]TXL71150.1 hypothetical protein FHP25_31610 [Vineibacter terrae]